MRCITLVAGADVPPAGLVPPQIVPINAIPDGWMGLDIGPDSIKTFQTALSSCKQVRRPPGRCAARVDGGCTAGAYV